jgi:hypothetical protein
MSECSNPNGCQCKTKVKPVSNSEIDLRTCLYVLAAEPVIKDIIVKHYPAIEKILREQGLMK